MKYQVLITLSDGSLDTFECVLGDAETYINSLKDAGIYAICCEKTIENIDLIKHFYSLTEKMKRVKHAT